MQTRGIDLNLVRMFVAIFETKSVSLAAARLCVAQPTVSYGLASLRRVLHDSLFIRTREGMIPTMHAKQAYGEFTAALTRIDRVVDGGVDFEPSRVRRRFTVAMSDIGELIFLPPLLPSFMQKAPQAELEVVDASASDIVRRLATGEVNAVVGNLPALVNETHSEILFEERYVCMLATHHTAIGKTMSREEFIEAKHVVVKTNFSGHNRVEEALQKHGITRHIALQIPHFAILARLIATTDLLVLVPSRVAKLLATYEPLKAIEMPVPIPQFQVRIHWHEKDDQNPASAWLRSVIADALKNV